MPNDQPVHVRLRKLRVLREEPQAAIAKAVGLTPSQLSRIESGSRGISADEMGRLLRALRVREDEFARWI